MTRDKLARALARDLLRRWAVDLPASVPEFGLVQFNAEGTEAYVEAVITLDMPEES